jgi:structural maintenance of chromosome 3 (chondroitin sulfate proteoglycan 6)
MAAARASHSQMTAQLDSYKAELQTTLKKKLDKNEEERLEHLSVQCELLAKKLSVMSAERSELETAKNILEIELTTNLRRRRDEALGQLDRMSISGDYALKSREEELQSLQQLIITANRKFEGLYIFNLVAFTSLTI